MAPLKFINKMPRKSIPLPTLTQLNESFHYEKNTGILFWKTRPVEHFTNDTSKTREHLAAIWNTRYAGTEAGIVTNDGYKRLCLDKRQYLTHRVIYKILHGVDPDNIDHADGDKINNRPANLVSKSVTGNMQNKLLYKNNKSGCPGVTWADNCSKWRVQIHLNKKSSTLGYFKHLDDAINARKAAAEQHGFTARHGS